MNEKLMTVQEVAERLRVSEPTVSAWLRTGKLRGFRAGRLWRIYESSFRAMVEGQVKSGDGNKAE